MTELMKDLHLGALDSDHIPDLLVAIKACGKHKDLPTGLRIHSYIIQRALVHEDLCINNALISMYAKCGKFWEAETVFDEISSRNVVTWNALICGYVQNGLSDKALMCFRDMVREEAVRCLPDATTFSCILKACGNMSLIEMGEEIHGEIKKKGILVKNIVLGTALVDMYAKCGKMDKAQQVFDELTVARDVVLWTSLIGGYVENGFFTEAIDHFQLMKEEGISPNAFTFSCILKACGSIGFLEMGKEIHEEINNTHGWLLVNNVVLGTSLIDMYGKCGMLTEAQKVFDHILVKDIFSWNALISGYAQNGLGDQALNCLRQMQRVPGILPNAMTFASILNVCGYVGSLKTGEEIHAEVRKHGLLESNNVILGSALIGMYAKCGAIVKAQEVFDGLSLRDAICWNSLINGYSLHGLHDEVLRCFGYMQDEGFLPDVITFSCMLRTCASMGSWKKGEMIHARVVTKEGFLVQKYTVVVNVLIDMYAKCGLLLRAREIFDGILMRSVDAWANLIAGYAQNGISSEALKCFGQMQEEGLSPDEITFVYVLKACGGNLGLIKKGEEIHAIINGLSLLENNIMLGTALVDMYANCHSLSKAREVFDKLPCRDIVSWTTLISGYVQNGLNEDGLKSLKEMQVDGITPDAMTFACILKACGNMGLAKMGEEIHGEVRRKGLLGKNTVLNTALVDMYSKCGMPMKAKEIFDEFPSRDVILWNAHISSYVQVGQVREAFSSFARMVSEGISPNAITFLALLTSCSHAGLVKEGEMYFDAMDKVHFLVPTIEHYCCMVDLYARVGLFEEAIALIEKAPSSSHLQMWLGVLGGCQKWVYNVELGRWAFHYLLHLDEKCEAAYVGMSNIYGAIG